MTRVLTVVSLAAFAAALVARSVDPIVPPIAGDLGVDPKTAALLSTAFAIPFALVPPVLGPLGDVFGKVRLIRLSLLVLVLANLAAMLATDFEFLIVMRVIAGMAAGGVFPLSLALFADLVPLQGRQVAIGRLLSIVVTGNLLGAAVSGLVADLAGWRAVFAVTTACGTLGLAAVTLGLRGVADPPVALLDLRSVPASYRDIFRNPRAAFCFLAVFLEGAAIFGLFPYVAVLLHAAGEERSVVAGLLIGAFSIGGLAYTLFVSRLLERLGPIGLMTTGACVAALSLVLVAFEPPWFLQFGAFLALGFGFYALHGYIQVQSSELSEKARGAAISLHASFFFLGQGTGPVLYGLGIGSAGTLASVLCGAFCVVLVGVLVRLRLSPRPSAAPE